MPLPLGQQSSTGVGVGVTILPSRGCVAMAGDVFGCFCRGWWWHATGIHWAEARGVAKHPAIHWVST